MTARVAIFDLGMVLATPMGLYEGLAGLLGTTTGAVQKGFWGPHRHAYDEGGSDRAFWEAALPLIAGARAIDLDVTLPELVDADTNGWRTIRPGAREILVELNRADIGVHVLSNAPRHFAESSATFDWRDLVDTFFFSGLLGVAKPDPAIYAAVEGSLGLSADALWFIDDKQENVTTATSRGWHAHLWIDDDDTRAWLAAEGFLS
ncbi:MAG: HAD-IA family hydrolase [Propionibacteriaceae bacterium]